jgi:hypothetical protein
LAGPFTDVQRSDRNGLSIASRFQESVNDTDISEPFPAARFGFLVRPTQFNGSWLAAVLRPSRVL